MTDLANELDITDAEREQLDEPDFEHATRVHDWRNYVPEAIQRNWKSLSMETRLVIYAMAERQANAERWD